MINCIILDDEPLAIRVIENFIKKIDFLNCIGTFPNANDAVGTLKKEKVLATITVWHAQARLCVSPFFPLPPRVPTPCRRRCGRFKTTPTLQNLTAEHRLPSCVQR